VNGAAVDLSAVNGDAADASGVAQGAELLAFTEAVMSGQGVAAARVRLRAVLPPEGYVAAAGVIGAFNVVDRIADATGIPLDDMMLAMSGDVRAELGLARFGSAANTPSA
jgi:hypothetical protein